MTTNNGYRCVTIGRFGDIDCTRPAIAMVQAVDNRVTQHRLDHVSSDAGATARNRLALHWMPAAQPTTVSALDTSIRSWKASISDADTARFLDHTLDVQRHRTVTHELTRKIQNARHELARHIPNSDGLNGRHHLAARWNESTTEERRRLLRFAWDRIEIVKAAGPGGPFDDQRIRYHPTP